MKTILVTVIAAAALVLAPSIAHADDGIDYEGPELVAPPADWPSATYDEWIQKLDPVACVWSVEWWHYERNVAVYDETGEIVSFDPWDAPTLESSDYAGNGTLDECSDWVENDDGSTSYDPPPVEIDPGPIVEELVAVVGPVMKRGING